MNCMEGDNGIPHGTGSLCTSKTSSHGFKVSIISFSTSLFRPVLSIFDLLTRIAVLFGEVPGAGELDFFFLGET